ncbi:alpha/beta fold hydrolase [Frigoriglobus tundricola]|uniref:AB hydrolase-1 domain-containing protein n=1 Tax=Frigoriglobus tundricola TaxID=2774151 RepID=A0A6M5YFT7_9BACT|nr:alpha/beta hydrolase [Frigoriglobus tundricola]QJW92899.1 hypothetical protein FTUN_0396 [Frigoriglobus tundricola]
MIMLSGMAADERLFAPQLARFPNLRVQPWVQPFPGEALRGYASRLARLVDPGRPCIVGGASFGGIVALEMAPHLSALGCVLIGSVRSPLELPWRWRYLAPLAELGPDRVAVLTRTAAHWGNGVFARATLRRLERLSRPEAAFVRWAMCAVVRWRSRPATGRTRVFQIHGALDRTLPVERTRPDVIVPAGGHALTLFSPAAVNEFLAAVVRGLTDQMRPKPALRPALPSPPDRSRR